MNSYEFFDHTADVGLRVRGRDLKTLFVHAAKGLFDLIAEPKKPKKTRMSVGAQLIAPLQIKISAPSQEELLVSWLRELIYLSSTRRMVFWDFKIKRMDVGANGRSPLRLHAAVVGEKMDTKKHILKKEVKAMTYHGLSLKKTRAGWVAEVILDV